MPGGISPSVLDALRFATGNGAAAMGLARDIGSLEAGKRADIIALRQDGLHFMPPAPVIPAIVLQARASDVEFVMVDGNIRKRDGRLLRHDIARLRASILATQEHLNAALDLQQAGPDAASATGRAYAHAIGEIVAH